MMDNDIVLDMVSECSIKLPASFNPAKGSTCKAMAYIIMKQFLLDRFKFFGRKKNTQTIFIEDLEDGVDGISRLVEIEIDFFEYNKQTLMEKKELFNRIENKLHRKVANRIVDAIENPNRYTESYCSFIKDISKKCKVSVNNVYSTIHLMRELMVGEES
jgi:hypothetical protein